MYVLEKSKDLRVCDVRVLGVLGVCEVRVKIDNTV